MCCGGEVRVGGDGRGLGDPPGTANDKAEREGAHGRIQVRPREPSSPKSIVSEDFERFSGVHNSCIGIY